MSSILRLTFKTAGSGSKAFNIPSPKEDLDPMEVKDVMDQVLSSGIFRTSTGALSLRSAAEYIKTTTTKLL